MNIGYHSDFMDRIIERADKRQERMEKMINKMLDKSEQILNAGKPKHNDIKVPPFTDAQKKLIEMTEKLAEKRGGRICDVDDDITDIKELLNDTISRIENPTNEEWFCSLSTEEKAKRIINIAVNSDCDYRTIVEWLKEIHDGNMGRNPKRNSRNAC